jgi:type II secretion system protein J
MRAKRSRRNQSGFTLIELVISASLMALIMGAAYVCFSSGVASQKLVNSRTEVLQGARVAMAILSADLRCACPLSKDFQFLGMNRRLGDLEADNLDFATHNYTPHRARDGDFCEVSYFLQKETESGLYHLWRRRNPTIALDPLAGGTREEIARGLRGFKLEYYDGLDWYDEWGDVEGRGKAQNSWREHPNLSGMPEAVRVTMWFDPERQPNPSAELEKATAEAPLVFQTVVRLNLATISWSATSSGASGSNSAPGSSSSRSVAPGGGRE